jgi:hypothetical protein
MIGRVRTIKDKGMGGNLTQKQNELLASSQVDKLATLVEEATRATTDAPKRFIEPARGTLDRAKSRRHHLIFGRRGSGKTSLLRKASADLTLRRIPTAFVDLETFKGHTYPDVLLSVLIETLNAFDVWLKSAGLNPASKTSFWARIWGGAPKSPPLNKQKVEGVRKSLQKQTDELMRLLHSEDQAALTSRIGGLNSADSEASITGKASVSAGGAELSATGAAKATIREETNREVTETYRRSKIDYLHRRIIDFQKLFGELVELPGSDAYVFLDDLYHIARNDQANLLDYFHRIAKGRSVWLKVGTIRHRTEWYHHGNPPFGLKLGDDCDDIDLDITLEKYEIAKRFLLQILDQLVAESGLTNHDQLLAAGGVDRLVLASGGVARDFLTIFRKAIDVARERGMTYRGERINAEDVNVAAGEHDPSKRDELKRDTLQEREQLEHALKVIQAFCVHNNANCFLVERDRVPDSNELGELVDLRFVHVVESRTTVRGLPGKLFTAYMLDISQYTGERRRRELEMISFWKRRELDKIRQHKYVLDPATLREPIIELAAEN